MTLAVFYSDTGVGIAGIFLLIYGGLALVLVWTARGVLVLIARARDSSRSQGRPKWLWFAVPLSLVVAAMLAYHFEPPHNVLFRLRFRLSEPALAREAEKQRSSSRTESTAVRRIGLFWVQRMHADDRQVRFITASCGVVDSCGFVYSPDGRPKRWQEDQFEHLGGPWWHLYEGF